MSRFKLKSAFSRYKSKSTSNSPEPEQTQGNPSSENNLSYSISAPVESDSDDDPPLTPLDLLGYKSTTKNRLLKNELAEEIRLHIPPILQVSHSWRLLYSLEQNGTSLNTLYNNSKPEIGESLLKRKGYLLIIMDSHHQRFGAYLSDYLRPLDRKTYYGNGDCFLWKSETDSVKDISTNEAVNGEEQIRLKVFPYTSLNDFIIYSNHQFISIGSGDGKFGLYVNGDFESGNSDPVDTFGNEGLSKTEKFRILGLELWKIN